MGLLRTVLAIAVVFAHTPHPHVFVGGKLAVQMFYMISGFLISYVLTNTPAYRSPTAFWYNRVLRLYPAYYFVAALTLIGYAAFNPAYWSEFAAVSLVDKIFTAIVNVTVIGQDWTFFLALRDGAPLPDLLLVRQSWTLGVELSFYLLAPFIVRRPRVLIALFALSVGARILAIAAGFGASDPWRYQFFPFELALFIAGMASHQMFLGRANAWASKNGGKRWPIYAVTGMIVAAFLYYPVPLPEDIKTLIMFAALFIALPFLFIYQRRSKWDRYIGNLSYPIYIGHLFVLLTLAYVVKHYQFVDPLSWSRALLGVAGSIAFAAFLEIAVTNPIERWRTAVRREGTDAEMPKPALYRALWRRRA